MQIVSSNDRMTRVEFVRLYRRRSRMILRTHTYHLGAYPHVSLSFQRLMMIRFFHTFRRHLQIFVSRLHLCCISRSIFSDIQRSLAMSFPCHASGIVSRALSSLDLSFTQVIMLSLHKTPLSLFAFALLLTLTAFSTIGVAKPFESIQWLDVIAEGGTAVMAGLWLLMTLSSRPRGKVTYLLAAGMGLIMLGAWADCMDEFYRVGKEQLWDHWLEAVFTLGGMVILTAGLYFWRHEQFSLNQHLQKRERLFRDHLAFDRVTQLVDANYLRRLIAMEQGRHSDVSNCVALLDINSFHLLNRDYGVEEGDRALQAVAHMLLLNLSNQDVLCRYAGDRFAIYMPSTTLASAQVKVDHLCAMVAQMHFYTQTCQVQITLRAVCSEAVEQLDDLLVRLDPLDPLSLHSEETEALAGLPRTAVFS